jgi:hypothetical protein
MKLPRQNCYKCGYEAGDVTDPYSQPGEPKAGDICMCLNCGTPTILDENLIQRAPTRQEALALSLNPHLIQLQLARSVVVGDKNLCAK